jgi:hypothetical protein
VLKNAVFSVFLNCDKIMTYILVIWLQFLQQSEGATYPFDNIVLVSTKVACSKIYSLLRMAESQHAMIRDVSYSKLFKANEIADVVSCSLRAIFKIKKILCCFSSTKAPPNSVGGPEALHL